MLHIIIYSELKKWGGGRERWMKYFIKHINNFFDRIQVYYLKKNDKYGSLSEEITDYFVDYGNIEWHPIAARNYLDWTVKASSKVILNAKKKDVVISVGSGPEALAGLIVKTWKKNIVFLIWLRTVLESELISRKSVIFASLAGKLEKVALKKSDVIIANGFDTKEYYQCFIRDKNIEVIPNALEDITPVLCINTPQFKHVIKIAFIGRFVKERGSNYFLEIAEKLKNDKRFQFEVYGPAESIPNFENVIFNGPFLPEDLPNILSKIDVAMFLLPSKSIHGGGVSHGLLECMAARRLIIAWENPIFTLNDLLTSENSVLVDEGNVNGVIIKLGEIAANPDKFIEKCENAFLTAQRFSVDSHIKRFINIINRITG
jgi:glycosyltransferase involved in cell wall biosynthesis